MRGKNCRASCATSRLIYRIGDGRSRHRTGSAGPGSGQRSAHPSGAQLCRPRHREPARAKRRGQTASWHHSADRFSPVGRPADDGRGLDAARIKAKALEAGLVSESDMAAKSQAEINDLIFAPGFSTALAVTSISGRGVGMDIVRSNIEQIGGTVDVKSSPGDGTSFVIKIPLTLAIVAALIAEVAGERFAFPQLSVLELVRLGGEHRMERIKSAPVLRLRH